MEVKVVILTFLNDIALTIKNNTNDYNTLVKPQLNLGLRYPDACNKALSILMNKKYYYP